MSFDPLGFARAEYAGTPNFNVVRDPNSIQNVNVTKYMGRRFVPLLFNWLVYFTAQPVANIAVPIDVAGGNVVGGLLDQIRGVKIDNTNSTISVSVYFPDTGDLVTCAPQTIATLPVMTNGLKCWIIAQGLSPGFTPTTKIYLVNFQVDPVIDPQLQLSYPQWKGSPLIQRDLSQILTPGYGAPALGDQNTQTVFNWQNATQFAPLWGTPNPLGGFIYLTGYELNMFGTGGGYGTVRLTIGSTGPSGNIFNFGPAALDSSRNLPLASTPGTMNLKLDASEPWRFTFISNLSVAQAFVLLNTVYTYNPY